MSYDILVIFIVGILLGMRFGGRWALPSSSRLMSILAGNLLFLTGLSLGTSWFSQAVSSILPLSSMLAIMTMILSLFVAEMLWRRFS